MLTTTWRALIGGFIALLVVVVPVGQSGAKPVAGRGKIQGVIMDHNTKKPVSGGAVRLLVPKGEDAKGGWTKVDDKGIEVTTSEDGGFAFEKVAPGKYILHFAYPANPMSPGGAGVVRNEDATVLTVVVTGGKTTDIGKGWVQR
jgi:hypothetical protein